MGRESEIIEIGKEKGKKKETNERGNVEKEKKEERSPFTMEIFQTSQPCGSLSGGADLQQDLQIVGSAKLHSLVETHTCTCTHTRMHTPQSLTTTLNQNNPWESLCIATCRGSTE